MKKRGKWGQAISFFSLLLSYRVQALNQQGAKIKKYRAYFVFLQRR